MPGQATNVMEDFLQKMIDILYYGALNLAAGVGNYGYLATAESVEKITAAARFIQEKS